MKKKILFSAFIVIILIAFTSTINSTNAFSSLPPDGKTGSPGDLGGTCADCHGGTVAPITGVIFSNIPPTGYIPGSTYSFSVTMIGNATSIAYGFEMICEEAGTNLGKGTWISGTGSGVSGDYIKHSVKGTGSSKTWIFQWTAPLTTSALTFYGSFYYPNTIGPNNVKTSSVSYSSNITGLSENSKLNNVFVYPNPSKEIINISSSEKFNTGAIYSLDGKLVKSFKEQDLNEKAINVSDLNNGYYYMRIEGNDKVFQSNFIKNN